MATKKWNVSQAAGAAEMLKEIRTHGWWNSGTLGPDNLTINTDLPVPDWIAAELKVRSAKVDKAIGQIREAGRQDAVAFLEEVANSFDTPSDLDVEKIRTLVSQLHELMESQKSSPGTRVNQVSPDIDFSWPLFAESDANATTQSAEAKAADPANADLDTARKILTEVQNALRETCRKRQEGRVVESE